MATRFWLNKWTTSLTAPAHAEWEASPTGNRFIMGKVGVYGDYNPEQTVNITIPSGALGRDVGIAQYVSEPLAAQTISGTLAGAIRGYESSTAINAVPQVIARVVSADGQTTRGVLYAGDTSNVIESEFPFDTFSVEIPFPRTSLRPAALTPVDAQEGDRLVVEIGARILSTNTGTLYFYPRADFPAYVEFSQDLAFVGTDFSENRTGYVPDNWSFVGTHQDSSDWTVVADATALGGKRLRAPTRPSFENRILTWDLLNNRGDLDIKAKVRSDGNDLPAIWLDVYGDGTATGTLPDGIRVSSSAGFDRLYVTNYRSGTAVFNDVTNGVVLSPNTWYWFRVQRVDTTLNVKVWADGSSEPATWTYTKTHANIADTRTPRRFGVAAATNAQNGDIDSFGEVPAGPPPNVSVEIDAPSATVAEAIAPDAITAQWNTSLEVPIADAATTSAFDPSEIIAVIRVDVTIEPPVATVAANAGDPSGIFGTGVSSSVFSATLSGSAYAPTLTPPDRIATDFSTASTGSGLPAGWSLFVAGNPAIQDNAGADGGKELYLSGNAYVGATWDLLTGRKGNYLLRLRNVDSQASAGLLIGASGTFLYTRVAVQDALGGRLVIQRRTSSAGSMSTLATAPATNLGSNLDDGTYIWLRVSLGEDGLVRAKAWREGQAEPAWQLEYTPSALDTGSLIGPFADNGQAATSVWIDSLEWLPGTTGVDTSTVLRWQTLPLVQKTLSTRWAARKAIDSTRSLVWGMSSDVPVQTSVSIAWNSVQQVKVTSSLRWDTFREAVASRALRWVFSESVDQVSRTLRWNVRQAVEAATLDIQWAEVVEVAEPTTVQINWAEISPVEKRSTLRWVTQSEGRVTLSLRARWDTLVTTVAKLRSRWSSNLDALGVLVEDFDDDPLGQLRSPAESRWQPYNDQSQFEMELSPNPGGYGTAPSTQGLTILEEESAFGRHFLRKAAGSSPVYFLDEPDPWEHDVVVRFRALPGEPVIIDVDQPNTRRYGYDTHRLVGDFTSGGRWTFGYWYAPQNEFNRFTQSSTALVPWSAGEWMWARIQLRHDKANQLTQGKAKVWKDGTSEPKNWTLDYTLNGVSGPAQVPPGTRVLGTSNEYVIYPAPIDLDRVSWTTPHTRVVLEGPATATARAADPVVSLRQTILAPAGRAGASFPEPKVEIGDQVLVSWVVLEIPAAVSVVEAVEVLDLAPALFEMPNPTVTAQASRSVAAPTVVLTGIQMPAPTVIGHQGVGIAVENVAEVAVAAPDVTVRVVAHATTFAEPGRATAQGLEPTLTTEFNARIEAPTSSATFGSPKPDSINGSREVEIEAPARAGASMIPVQGVVATLSIQVDNATLAQAQALPADARTGLAVATSPATASASGLAPAVQTSIRITMEPAKATFRARDTALTRTSTRFSVGATGLAIIATPDPEVQVFFQRVDASVAGAAAYGLFKAVAPEFLSTPAEVGEGLVLYLGSTVGDVRLAVVRADVHLGSTRGTVTLADVRDEERV